MQPTQQQRDIADAQTVVQRIGMQLIAEKKAAINKEIDEHSKDTVAGFQGRDVLTLLIKANMSAEVPENQRLTDDEVLARTLRLFFYVFRQY